MQLGMAIIVSDDVHNAMRRLQLEVAQACGANPALKQIPHITVKQPFDAKELAPIEAYFDRLVETTAPFEVAIRGTGCFADDRVVFLDVVPSPALEALRQRVLRELSQQFLVKPRDVEDARYRFHASLAYGLSEEKFACAWDLLRNTRADASFTAAVLGLFYFTGEEWIAYKRSRLASVDG